MDKKRPKTSANRRAKAPIVTAEPRQGSWKQRSSSVLWLKLNFTIKAARLQTLKRQKYQHLQEEALLKARGLLKNWEDGPVLLTEDLYSRARSANDAQELINYTPEALALRFSLRNHPDVIDAVKQLWAVELPRDAMGCIDQHGYASLFRRIGRCLEPDATKRRLRRMERTIKEDWIRDSKGDAVMSFANFFDSVFELADLWCESIEADEYIAFLRTLVEHVSTLRRNKRDPNNEGRRLLRSLQQIKAIDDEESSSEDDSPSEYDDELPSEHDSDGDDDEEEQMSIQLPLPVTSTSKLGFLATKVLQAVRAKTPSSIGLPPDANNSISEDNPGTRERRASVITLGGFSINGLGSFTNFPSDKEADPKTPTALSAKSRGASVKMCLNSVHESRSRVDDGSVDGGVQALVAMHRLHSTKKGITVDTAAGSAGLGSQESLTLGLHLGNIPQQRPQKPVKSFPLTSGIPKTVLKTNSITSDGLITSGVRQDALTNSAPRLKATGRLKADTTFGDINPARVASSSARRALMSSSPLSKPKPKGDPKRVSSSLNGQVNKRLAALNLASSSTFDTSKLVLNSPGDHDIPGYGHIRPDQEVDSVQSLQQDSNGTPSGSQAQLEYISGLSLDRPVAGVKDSLIAIIRKKSELIPVNPTLPFYTFDESVSPAKRVLPPVLDDRGWTGVYSSDSNRGRRQRSGSCSGNQGPDFSASCTTTGYLTQSLQAELLSRTQHSALQQSPTLGLSFPGKEATRSHIRRKSMAKRTSKQSPDDSEVTVSPWDADLYYDHDELVRARPRPDNRNEQLQVNPVAASSIEMPIDAKTPFVEDLSSTDAPTLSVSSSKIPLEPPSCILDLTTMPHEYHELVLDGSALNSYKRLSRTASAPIRTRIQTPVRQRLSREPQWMLQVALPPSLTLLEDGVVEGRTVAGSPRSILAALAAKRPRREVDEDEDVGWCPRFVKHLDSHGNRSVAVASPLFRRDQVEVRCTCCEDEADDESVSEKLRVNSHCSRHKCSNNNRQDENEPDVVSMEQRTPIQDVTVIVNATRGLVLRPGTMDRYAAKRAKFKQQATRSDMMRRRCQYTFAKQLS